MELHVVKLDKPEEVNLVFGMSHFIKTVEDLHEALATAAPGIKFGIAFCEASGPRLLRHSGNDDAMRKLAIDNLEKVNAGHSFLIMLSGVFPIHVMRAIRSVPEICRIYCATANPVEVIVAQTEQGRGVKGVIDGSPTVGVEDDEQIAKRKGFLRTIGYKL
ncbi:MAG TPA: adenosine-specific kinase [Polyangiaceae bacterium]|nr:adenosine-specific kinase [Polyangiaceae bacterium]